MHPEPTVIVAAKCLLLHGRKALLLQRAPDQKVCPGNWEFAGGKLNFGETPQEALLREVWEETGLHIKAGQLLYASSFFSSPARQIIVLCYLSRAHSNVVRLSKEHQSYQWVGKNGLAQMLPENILQDIHHCGILQQIELDD